LYVRNYWENGEEREFMAAVGRIIAESILDRVADLVRTTRSP
jgi:hypothetical protein